MRITSTISLCAAIAASTFVVSLHAELPPDVLAKNSWVELTRADYDAALARLPQKMRYGFATSPKRIQDLLNSLLLTKTLAAQARAHGLRPAPAFDPNNEKLQGEDRALAAAELQRIEEDASREFDARKADFEAKALEVYKTNRDAYRTPEELRLSDIAVLIKGRGEDAARERAAEARAKILAGADFASVAREYSDDPTTRDKGGALPFMPAGRMAPSYAKVVFALKNVGDVSEPIPAPSAYHVARLEERKPSEERPFEQVRDSIMSSLRASYVADKRDLRMQQIYSDPKTEANEPAIDALVNRVDPKVFRNKSGKSAPVQK
jgi:hypothetical protein